MIKARLRSALSSSPPLLRAADKVNDGLKWLHWRLHRPPYPPGPETRLHLGCGEIDHPGFVNIDARPRRHVHHVQGIDDLRAFADNSVSLIYGSHCLEHVSHLRVPQVLREWHRVLKPGGVLRLSVPDFDLLVDIYLQTGRELRSMILPLMGGQEYAFNFHYTCFNIGELSRLLIEAGFGQPRRWQHGTEPFTSLPDWSGRPTVYRGCRYAVSLNLEATK